MAKPHELVLALLKPGLPITPQQINAQVGMVNGYAPQYIHRLRKLGYEIESTFQGKFVVAYRLVCDPTVMVAANPGIIDPQQPLDAID